MTTSVVLKKLSTTTQRIGISGIVALSFLAVILLAWTFTSLPGWINNPDLSHGLFTPLLFGLLIRESFKRESWKSLPHYPKIISGMFYAVLLGSVFCLALGSLYAVATEWGHPVVKFLIGVSVTGLVFSAWIHFASAPVRLIPLNWVSGAAVALWFLSLPVPPGTYHELTLSLQFRVTENVLAALHLLGIPAIRTGNIIDLAHTSVGVEEACSGVRSLVSCIYAGVFFSAVFVRSLISRISLILIAPFLALVMNFVRSLSLTLLANYGVNIEGFWHDTTGYAILACTAIMLALLAILLDRFESNPSRVDTSSTAVRNTPIASYLVRQNVVFSITCSVGLIWMISLATLSRSTSPANTVAPSIASWLPEQVDGWIVSRPQDLYQFSEILETENLVQRSYAKTDEYGNSTFVTIYLAYWKPGQTSVSNVATHTPDACWPGAGWVPEPASSTSSELLLPQRKTSAGEYRVFSYDEIPRHVWFWHSYDGEVLRDLDPRRPIELIASVLRYGIRSEGEQLFVRFSSNRPWDEISEDPLISEVFEHLQPYGI
jgi:exosortase